MNETDDVGVDFVGNDRQSQTFGDAQNLAQMSSRVDGATRIRRVVDDDAGRVVVCL